MALTFYHDSRLRLQQRVADLDKSNLTAKPMFDDRDLDSSDKDSLEMTYDVDLPTYCLAVIDQHDDDWKFEIKTIRTPKNETTTTEVPYSIDEDQLIFHVIGIYNVTCTAYSGPTNKRKSLTVNKMFVIGAKKYYDALMYENTRKIVLPLFFLVLIAMIGIVLLSRYHFCILIWHDDLTGKDVSYFSAVIVFKCREVSAICDTQSL
ncbi:hypothetical protein HELRODRAFT_182237 [Helobdella robusta]|uniref:Uncharacterized protein n=1 Tax=Helobdella robusta TaxID=6412 RepID=T1FHZ2_HELRO|nr:hypothetical protein HELRODRAFT_182237 [Helobdella robusta]ESN91082.1 hypothetical protein HELRODRAFT_182237 [Helobdella robusta]